MGFLDCMAAGFSIKFGLGWLVKLSWVSQRRLNKIEFCSLTKVDVAQNFLKNFAGKSKLPMSTVSILGMLQNSLEVS